MPRRGDICQHFNSSMFRYFLRKRYKNHKTFAKRMGVSFQAVYAWSNGDSKPTWKHLIKMADIFNIPPRRLVGHQGKQILQLWEDHLTDYIMAPPEIKHETKITLIGDDGSSHSEKTVKRELKLTSKEAIELTEKLGIFDGYDSADTDGEQPNPLHALMLEDLVDDADIDETLHPPEKPDNP